MKKPQRKILNHNNNNKKKQGLINEENDIKKIAIQK